jgi:seryl-tRNA synthetase
MIDLKLLRSQPEMIREICRRRGASIDLDKLLDADLRVRTLTAEVDSLRQKRKSCGPTGDREAGVALRSQLSSLETELRQAQKERDALSSWVPNLLAEDTPVGTSDKDNVEVRRWGNPRQEKFEVKTHEVVAGRLGILDEERGAKVAGAGFSYWVGDGARLAWGLFSLALAHLSKKGFQQMFTPVVARQSTLFGTGYLPFFADQIYRLENSDLSLIGTSEQTLIGYHADEIVPWNKLPLLYTAFTPCFRTEAGSYGRESRGLFRQHQFHKVEQIVFCEPESSEEWLQKCLTNAEELLQALEVPYRVVRVCDGDLGAPGYKKYDVEGWFAGYGGYRETHSITNLTDFQTRRLNVRSKSKDGQSRHLHTISATMITDRALLAILENCQKPDCSITVPSLLRPFVDDKTELTPAG